MRFSRDESGATAVEFAIMLPMFLALIFGIVVFGSYLTMVHGVQQLAAEAARTSVAGLSNAERNTLANSYVASSIADYPLLDPAKVDVVATPSGLDPNAYIVRVNYDASASFIFSLPFVPPLPQSISRSAVIPYGGF
jgi:Flp pilus assembly protein TadG